MNRSSRIRQIGGFIMVALVLGFGLASRVAAAVPPVDLRGEWAASAAVGTTLYPQTLSITSEDFATGRIGGTDTGTGGSTFTLVGQISGSTLTMTISDASYQSNSTATISGTPPLLSLSGPFTDSNHADGTFTARLTTPLATAPLVSAPLASAGSTDAPTNVASSAATSVVAAPLTNPPPAGMVPSSDLPLIAAVLAAVLLVGGVGIAAATGVLPGMGSGGSATGSGGGGSEAGEGSGPPAGQQTSRWKIQQAQQTRIYTTPQDYTSPPIRPGGVPPPLSAEPTWQQQMEREKIQLSSPAVPATPPEETIGPASAVPVDGPPVV